MKQVRQAGSTVLGRLGIGGWILGILFVWLIGSIVAGETAPRRFMESPAAKVAYAPKSGRVIDSATGVGISGATVVATGYYRAEVSRASLINLVVYTLAPVDGRSGENPLYATTSTTDGQGAYSLGDMHDQSWGRVKILPAFPAYIVSADWSIRAVKLGYIPSAPQRRPANVAQSDATTTPILVDDFVLQPAADDVAGLQSEARAYVELLPTLGQRNALGRRQSSMQATGAADFLRDTYPYFLGKICALPAQEPVPSELVFDVLALSSNEAEVIKRLNPDLWWIRYGQIQSHESVGESAEHLAVIDRRGETKIKSYAAGAVCAAMRGADAQID